MKKLIGSAILVVGAILLGIFLGMKAEVSNDGVKCQTVHYESVGYKEEAYIPEYLPVGYMDEFEEHIWDMYITEYCVNYCGTCDSYSYEHCLCCECTDDSECIEADYQLFIEDNMSMIMDEYNEILIGIQEDYRGYDDYVIYEF